MRCIFPRSRSLPSSAERAKEYTCLYECSPVSRPSSVGCRWRSPHKHRPRLPRQRRARRRCTLRSLPSRSPPPVRQGKDINIRIDGTVIESRGDKVVDKKVISVTCVDGRSAFVRSSQQVPFRVKGSEGFAYRDQPLNMDADVTLRDDGRVLARITVEYRTSRHRSRATRSTAASVRACQSCCSRACRSWWRSPPTPSATVESHWKSPRRS